MKQLVQLSILFLSNEKSNRKLEILDYRTQKKTHGVCNEQNK